MHWQADPDEETTDWRAVCGRTARTVRRAGTAQAVPDPYRMRCHDRRWNLSAVRQQANLFLQAWSGKKRVSLCLKISGLAQISASQSCHPERMQGSKKDFSRSLLSVWPKRSSDNTPLHICQIFFFRVLRAMRQSTLFAGYRQAGGFPGGHPTDHVFDLFVAVTH